MKFQLVDYFIHTQSILLPYDLILCSRWYILKCYIRVTTWVFFTVQSSIENQPSQLMQVRPWASRSSCKNSRETGASLPGMTGISLISLLSSCLSVTPSTPWFQLQRNSSKAPCLSGLQVSAWSHSCRPSSRTATPWTDRHLLPFAQTHILPIPSQRDLLSKSPAK